MAAGEQSTGKSPPKLDYFVPQPRPKPTHEQLNRAERTAAFWVLGTVVAVPFGIILLYLFAYLFGG